MNPTSRPFEVQPRDRPQLKTLFLFELVLELHGLGIEISRDMRSKLRKSPVGSVSEGSREDKARHDVAVPFVADFERRGKVAYFLC